MVQIEVIIEKQNQTDSQKKQSTEQFKQKMDEFKSILENLEKEKVNNGESHNSL